MSTFKELVEQFMDYPGDVEHMIEVPWNDKRMPQDTYYDVVGRGVDEKDAIDATLVATEIRNLHKMEILEGGDGSIALKVDPDKMREIIF